MLSGVLPKLYALLALGLIGTYFTMEVKGAVFSGTDRRPSQYQTSSGRSGRSGGSGGGGVFFWGTGYRGGK